MRKGRHLGEEIEVVCQYGLGQTESEGLVEVLQLVEITDALRCPNRYTGKRSP